MSLEARLCPFAFDTKGSKVSNLKSAFSERISGRHSSNGLKEIHISLCNAFSGIMPSQAALKALRNCFIRFNYKKAIVELMVYYRIKYCSSCNIMGNKNGDEIVR